MSGIVTEVTKYKKGWTGGLPETPCGFGSRVAETEIQREWIPKIVAKYNIRTIHDIGAGDLNWIKQVVWPYPVTYKAFDLVPRSHEVTQFDLIHEIPQPVDLTLCLWVLNHLPEDHARKALENLRASGSTFLIYTWWPAMADFLDIGWIESVVIRGRIRAEIRLVHNNPVL